MKSEKTCNSYHSIRKLLWLWCKCKIILLWFIIIRENQWIIWWWNRNLLLLPLAMHHIYIVICEIMYVANEHTFSSQRIYSKCSLCYMPSYFSSWESKLNNCWALEYIHLLLLELQILNNRLRLMVLIYLQWKILGNHFALERFANVLSGLILPVEIIYTRNSQNSAI